MVIVVTVSDNGGFVNVPFLCCFSVGVCARDSELVLIDGARQEEALRDLFGTQLLIAVVRTPHTSSHTHTLSLSYSIWLSACMFNCVF